MYIKYISLLEKRSTYVPKHRCPGLPTLFELDRVKFSIVTAADLGRDDDSLWPGPWDSLCLSRSTDVAGHHQQQVETLLRKVKIFDAAPSLAAEPLLYQIKHNLSVYEMFSMPVNGGISTTSDKDTYDGPGEVPSGLTS